MSIQWKQSLKFVRGSVETTDKIVDIKDDLRIVNFLYMERIRLIIAQCWPNNSIFNSNNTFTWQDIFRVLLEESTSARFKTLNLLQKLIMRETATYSDTFNSNEIIDAGLYLSTLGHYVLKKSHNFFSFTANIFAIVVREYHEHNLF